MQVNFYPLFPPSTHFDVPMPDANRLLRELSKQPGMDTVYGTYAQIIDCLETVLPTANTYNSIRGDINVLCNWAWQIKRKDIIDLSLKDMNEFIDFCNKPPKHLIGDYSASLLNQKKSDSRFVVVNPNWRPFVCRTGSKYQRSESTLKAQLSNLSFVYIYFEDMEWSYRNPAAIAMRRLSSAVKNDLKPDRAEVGHKGMSTLQINYLFKALDLLVKKEPSKHERTRFLMLLMIFCYPRISEVSARPGYSPVMGDFEQHRSPLTDEVYYTFFIPNSKGGKSRKVICAPLLIKSLRRYRASRGLGDTFPMPDDNEPLFIRHRPGTHGRDSNTIDANLGISQIGEIVAEVFTLTSELLEKDGYEIDGAQMRTLTPHSCRHTGIQIDLASERDPRHVMLDAGHSSEATLSIYESKRTERRYSTVEGKNTHLGQLIKPKVIANEID